MDLIFKRYSNPFLFLDNLIENNELSEGIDTIIQQVIDERDYELYLSLNPFNEKSYVEWKNEIYSVQKKTIEEKSISKEEATNFVKAEFEKSKNILNNYKPPKN